MSDDTADMTRRTLLRSAAGAGAVSATAGAAAAQESGSSGSGGGGNKKPVFPAYVSGAKGGSYEDLRGKSEVTVEVGAGSKKLAFSPTKIWIDPGTTITFKWVSDGHNVVPKKQPASDMKGSGSSLQNTGYSYTETLKTAGMYTYYCRPHESLGMKGAIAVGSDVETKSVGGGGGGRPTVPDSAKSLGIVAGFAGASSLGLAYFFLKYGGSHGEADIERA